MDAATAVHACNIRSRSRRVSQLPRWGLALAGGTLGIYGLYRRSPAGVLMAIGGGAVAYLGVKLNTLQREPLSCGTVIVNCTPQEAYRFWRDLENLPRFMRHLDSVVVSPDGSSRWVAAGPFGARIEWKAEILTEREGELIAWRSLPGSDLDADGTVEFRPAPGRRGTKVSAVLRFHPRKGTLGHAVAKTFGKDPRFLITQDLRRFKALIETGEIPTTDGQTHGPRSVLTGVMRIMDPDRPIGVKGIAALLREARWAS